MLEVYRGGVPTKRLFFSEENARLWINRQTDGAEYTVELYDANPAHTGHA